MFVIMFVYAGMSGFSIFFGAIKFPTEKGFMVALLLVSLLGGEASSKREFMSILISQKLLLLVR